MGRFECSVASRARDEQLFATASPVRRWLAIEVRGAWGRDCVRDTELSDHVTPQWRQDLQAHGIRILAVRRNLDRDAAGAVRLLYANSGQPGELHAAAWTTDIEHLSDVMPATRRMPIGPGEPPPGWHPEPKPIALICTNGRHDSCCATFGRPLMRALRETPWVDQAWECSHVGGDRFAANVVILPEGLYYGRVDPDAVEALLERHGERLLLLDNYRGRSTLSFGEQAAEYFVRREHGIDGIDVVTGIHLDTDLAAYLVDVAGIADFASRRFAVSLRRTMSASPTPLTCKGLDGLSYPTYRLLDMSAVDAV
ncbi:MAG: hypothetical protein M3337_04890 [Actinomycetota bacterium]|nr:hypothetical protein [Actinomycetota bacterium]